MNQHPNAISRRMNVWTGDMVKVTLAGKLAGFGNVKDVAYNRRTRTDQAYVEMVSRIHQVEGHWFDGRNLQAVEN